MKQKKFPYGRIILLIVLFAVFVYFASTRNLHAQDNTSIELHTITGYAGIETYVKLSASFREPTSSVEGVLIFDNRLLRFTGITTGSTDGLVTYNHTPWVGVSTQDSVQFSFATAFYLDESDSLLVLRFVASQPGTAFVAMQNFVFNERGNDGVTWARRTMEIYPRELHPDFGGGGLEPDSVAQTVNLRYMLRDAAGDVSCDGVVSAYDAALILRWIVGLEAGFVRADSSQCPTPIVVELRDN